jgi:hypothetical protein
MMQESIGAPCRGSVEQAKMKMCKSFDARITAVPDVWPELHWTMFGSRISVNAIPPLGMMPGRIWMKHAGHKSGRLILKPIDHIEIHRKYLGGIESQRSTFWRYLNLLAFAGTGDAKFATLRPVSTSHPKTLFSQ